MLVNVKKYNNVVLKLNRQNDYNHHLPARILLSPIPLLSA
jgi:hypothetical protein